MLDMKFEMNRNQRGLIRIKNTDRTIQGGIRDALRQSGKHLVEAGAKEVRTGKKSGVLYLGRDRLGRRRLRRASAPGETAANRTGEYAKSFNYRTNGSRLSFGNSAPHSKFLEVGTRRMKPRPGIRNTVNKEWNKVKQHMFSSVEGAL